MRHRSYNPKFSRHTNARKGLFRGLAESLFEHGFIVTTADKAAVVKRLADKLITNGKKTGLSSRRLNAQFFGQRQSANAIVDKWVPLFKDRHSGYTKLDLVGRRRGDNTLMVKLSLAVAMTTDVKTDKPELSTDKKTKSKPVLETKKESVKPESESTVRQVVPKVVGSQVAKGSLTARPMAAAVKRPQAKG